MAKDCILQSVVEDSIARAANTRVQQHKPEDMAKLVEDAKVDLWREPTTKEDPGWRGPAQLIKKYPSGAKAVVDWRGHCMLVPIRHLRPHVGFATMTFFLSLLGFAEEDGLTEAVSTLLDLIESMVPYKHFQLGLVYDSEAHSFIQNPTDLDSNPPPVWTQLKMVAKILKISRYDGVQFGTKCKRTEVVPSSVTGRLLVWHHQHRASYVVVQVQPYKQHLINHYVTWSEASFVLYYPFHSYDVDDVRLETAVSIDAIGFPPPSPIPWQPSPWRSWLDEDEAFWRPAAPQLPLWPPAPPPQGSSTSAAGSRWISTSSTGSTTGFTITSTSSTTIAS